MRPIVGAALASLWLAMCSRSPPLVSQPTAKPEAAREAYATLDGVPLGPDEIAALLPDPPSRTGASAVRGAVELVADASAFWPNAEALDAVALAVSPTAVELAPDKTVRNARLVLGGVAAALAVQDSPVAAMGLAVAAVLLMTLGGLLAALDRRYRKATPGQST